LRFGSNRTLQHLDLLALSELENVVGITRGFDVQIGLVASYTDADRWSVLIVAAKLLQLVEDILADNITLFKPSFLAVGGSYANETPSSFEHLQAIAVLNQNNFVVHGSNAVTKINLRHGHVRDVARIVPGSAAAGQKDPGGHRGQQQRGLRAYA